MRRGRQLDPGLQWRDRGNTGEMGADYYASNTTERKSPRVCLAAHRAGFGQGYSAWHGGVGWAHCLAGVPRGVPSTMQVRTLLLLFRAKYSMRRIAATIPKQAYPWLF